ncbi:MAG: hypothetical protein II881_04070 [Oscillospiraceae bacterium]|nr:hypothetical protein [Oscillospiraceae bacterium]
MKDNKNKENVILENKALNGAMQELGDDELDEIAGAGNPFARLPRVPTQPIDEDMRNKG